MSDQDTIMVVEDDDDGRELIEAVLQSSGATVFAVASSQEAVESFVRADPDIVVLNAKIKDLENQLHSMATRYLAGIGTQVASLDTALGQFRRELDAIGTHRAVGQRARAVVLPAGEGEA